MAVLYGFLAVLSRIESFFKVIIISDRAKKYSVVFLLKIKRKNKNFMETLNLAGKWKLSRAADKEIIDAIVPGDNMSALLDAGKIKDPYYALNEVDLQWIGREDWKYSKTFKVTKTFLAKKSVYLSCEYVDTIAEIRVNGKLAGKTDNMFVRYRLEVKKFLKEGENTIEFFIKSPENTAVAEAKKMKYKVPYTQFPIQSPDRNMIRKVACHAGWDWGPCLMVSGIYGEVTLNATDDGRIEYVYSKQNHSKDACRIDATCEYEAVADGKIDFEIELGGETVKKTVKVAQGLNTITASVTVKKPVLWWPNGFGKQHLYTMTVKAGSDTLTKKIGLRTLELVSKEDKHGLSMLFKVNGLEIFAKGADWIPCDALPQRQTKEAMIPLLESAKKVHMNMLRVWGGGQYEFDYFYDLCDEMGLMVWHDFMFSCSLYPATKEFLATVKQEAVHQVKRLHDRACMALWCGNNENVGALKWYKEARENRDRYLVDYDRLNEGVLGATVDEFDTEHSFWPSSPCGGRGDYSDCWHVDNRGDMHYWEVWHGSKPFEASYEKVPRFCSEFGFQSFPSMDTIKTYAPESEWNVTAPSMEHHQRNPGGNTRVLSTMSMYFRIPPKFEDFVYMSQVQQGIAIKTAVEHWRHLRPVCMGTLYWQINDNWPVCSWASLDYKGKWKLLHYMAQRFYAPTIVSGFRRPDGKVEVWLTDDSLKVRDAKINVKVISFAGKEIFKETIKVKTKSPGALLVKTYEISDYVKNPEEAFMHLELDCDGKNFKNEVFFAEQKKSAIPMAAVKTNVKAEGQSFKLEIATDKAAFFVSANADGIKGEFDDNCFTMLAGEKRVLTFTPESKVSLEQFRKAVSVKHLRATYE